MLEHVSAIARQAVSVIAVKGLALWVGCRTDAAHKVGSSCALLADSTAPLEAQGVRRSALIQVAGAVAEDVSLVAGCAGTVRAVKGPALSVDLVTFSIGEVGESVALNTDGSVPLGAEAIGWLRFINFAAAALEEIAVVAGQAVSVRGIVGLAERVGVCADSIDRVSFFRAL